MKRIVTVVCVLLSLVLLLGLTACGPEEGTGSGDKYTVTFNYNYAGAPEAAAVEVDADTAVARPADPTRSGYLFDCWSTNRMIAREYDFSTAVTDDITLYAMWKSTSATVSFDTDGGTAIDDVTVDVGSKVTKPADPVKTGYKFAGWYADANYTTPFDFDSAIEDDTTLYARWNKTSAVVTYVVYTGYEGEDLTEVLDIEDGAKPATEPADPVRDRYEFLYWSTDRAGTVEYDFATAVEDDLTLYAQWRQVVVLVTLNYNYDGAENGSVRTDVGTPAVLPSEATRVGYTFGGWYADPACTTAFDASASLNGDVTVYAKWTPEVYTISFDLNGGTGTAPESQSVAYGDTATEPANPSRSGYVFSGWSTSQTGGDVFDFTTPVTGALTLYAQWTSESGGVTYTYYNNFDANDTSVYETDTPTPGDRVTPPADPERSGGWHFDGWYDNKECEGEAINFRREYPTVSKQLYAKWTPRYTFEAEYTNLNGKLAQGSSDNGSGPEVLIQSPLDVLGNGDEMGMSNGYYVGKLYYTGAFLEFNINASEADDDATIILRLTPDLYDMTFTPDSYQVLVNGTSLDYGEIVLDGAYKEGEKDPVTGADRNPDMNKRPFRNYVLDVDVELVAGVNTIRLVTTNSRDHGGTFNAETPLVDCIYVASDATLTWEECLPGNVGQTMDDVVYRT